MDEKPVPLVGEPAARDLGARIEARRGDQPFVARLRRLLDENASALQRLGSDTRAAERRGGNTSREGDLKMRRTEKEQTSAPRIGEPRP